METSTEQINKEMLEALEAFIEWRNGPEGPEVMFAKGAKLCKQVENAIASAKQKSAKTPLTITEGVQSLD
jgi:hypothetical protein